MKSVPIPDDRLTSGNLIIGGASRGVAEGIFDVPGPR